MFEAQIKHVEPFSVAYVVMRGSFDKIPEGFAQLYGGVTRMQLQPAGPPQAVYPVMPGSVPEAEMYWELWAPVAGAPEVFGPDESGFGVKLVPGGDVASTVYTGPYDGIPPTYEALGRWIAEKGLQPAGPPREIYFSEPDTPPEKTMTEVQFPVSGG